ncbi:Adenylylsulfatase HINT3 [Bienertia sinuspersici]
MDMEAQRRRMAVICSHLHPSFTNPRKTHFISTSNCSSESTSQHQIRDLVDNPNLHDDCVFCQIVRGNSPSFKLYEDDICLCILDTSPLSRGHSLLIPKRHYCSLDATPPSTHIHLIPRKAHDRLWASEVCLLLLTLSHHTTTIINLAKLIYKQKNLQSLRRLSLKLDQEAPHLAESIREQLLLANNKEECEDQGSALAGKL